MPKLTRRTFLSRSAGAAVTTALGGTFAKPSAASLLRLVADETGAVAYSSRLATGWEFYRGPLDGPWEVWCGEEIATFSPIAMPHCFNAEDGCDPDVPYYRGKGWYKTHIQPANPYRNGRTLLHFMGAGQATEVFLGPVSVGRHVGGYDEFCLDITDHIRATAQTQDKEGLRLSVCCDNACDLERLPSDLSDFSLYGGLYRPVNLVYVPEAALETLHVRVDVTSLDRADLTVSGRLLALSQAAGGLTVAIEILTPGGRSIHCATSQWSSATSEKVFPGDTCLGTVSIEHPELWSPSRPVLYECRVTVVGPNGAVTMRERFGIRHTEFVENGPFKLNGERLLLRGTHRHEDHSGYGAAMPDGLIRREMQLIKAMGANFIRLAHYQQSRIVLDLCDELGLLVWEEIPWCRSGVVGEPFKAMAHEKMRAMIDQHYNHPSILLWGLGNEDDWPDEFPVHAELDTADQQAIRNLMTGVRDLAHSLDPNRLTSLRRCDFARDIPDIYSPSIWAGWYSGRYTEYQRSLEVHRTQVKHFIHIEWGADSHAGRHEEQPDQAVELIPIGHGTAEAGLAYKPIGGSPRMSKDSDWSETYACDLFDWHLKTQEQTPWLTGAAQWIFKDFTTPLRVENPVPRVNQKGVVQRDLTPKESFYVFQSYWTDQADNPMVYIYGHSWPVRWGRVDQQRWVRIYSNCSAVELFLNGVSCGVKQRDIDDFPCAGLRWMLRFKPGKNTLKAVARNQAGREVSDSIDFLYQTESWSAPASFKLATVSTTDSTATVEATLHDASGILCLNSCHQVRFTLAGSGALIDNQGTPSGSRVVQLGNGRARISIERRGGASTLAISAPNLPTAFHSI
jgi:beta-galactosidase